MASLHILLILCVCSTALCLPTSSPTDIDEDDGKDQDISDINEAAGLDLVEGDMLMNEPTSSLTGNTEIDEYDERDQDIFNKDEATGLDLAEEDIQMNEPTPSLTGNTEIDDEDDGKDQDIFNKDEATGLDLAEEDLQMNEPTPSLTGNTEIDDEDEGKDQDIFNKDGAAGLDLAEEDLQMNEPTSSLTGNADIDEYDGRDQDMFNINEGNTEIDDEDGRDQDIFDINEAAGLDLVEGDILMHEGEERNAILGEEHRWPTTVPYVLDSSLDINAKGVIMKAFEQFRLKTCIDFKPRSSEANYIFVFKGKGCYSKVGNQHKGKQELSIGANCDNLATVEHEFLHALGFWHEQSRSDRDDYITIVWDQVKKGQEHNFYLHKETESSSLGVPYDYGSVMHYGKTSFSKGSKPTIVTKIPEFMEVIGQRLEFSDSDLLKLNRLYKCTTASTFLDSCQFEKSNICGMIEGKGGNAKWARVQKVMGGPQMDYTKRGQCRGVGFFMHFNTATGTQGKKAYLESRLFYPKRGSQCLQFYHYNSGAVNDQLNILVREYTVRKPKGALKLIQKISGGRRGSWELYHVTLNVSDKFRVVFEGVKGRDASKGGLSLDDINLSETQCPQHTWRIRDFNKLLATAPAGYIKYSPRFLSPDGYSFQIGLQIKGTKDKKILAINFHLTSGSKDKYLKWPCPWRQASIELMDQNPNIQHRMNNIKMITTDPAKTSTDSKGKVYLWDNPLKVGKLVTDADGSKYYRGPGYNINEYITQDRLKSRSFIKGNDVIFLLSLKDVTGLKTRTPNIRELGLEIVDYDTEEKEEEPMRQMAGTNLRFP